MLTVVISQPMYFPWVGLFEQLLLADTFVFLDDAQFSRGYINRVQYKTTGGTKWMTVPLQKHARETRICQLELSNAVDWREDHIRKLENSFSGAPYAGDALQLFKEVVSGQELKFSELAIASFMKAAEYFNLGEKTTFLRSSSMGASSKKGALIKDIVLDQKGDHYVSGMGGLNYLDHEDFENSGIRVSYMDYKKKAYPQTHGEFTPYVTVLDLIANCGVHGRKYIGSGAVDWRIAIESGEAK